MRWQAARSVLLFLLLFAAVEGALWRAEPEIRGVYAGNEWIARGRWLALQLPQSVVSVRERAVSDGALVCHGVRQSVYRVGRHIEREEREAGELQGRVTRS